MAERGAAEGNPSTALLFIWAHENNDFGVDAITPDQQKS